MATPDRESIETFMSITGSSELIAIQKLTEHGANLNAAVNAHFTQGDANTRPATTDVNVPQEEDLMDIDEVVPPRDVNRFTVLHQDDANDDDDEDDDDDYAPVTDGGFRTFRGTRSRNDDEDDHDFLPLPTRVSEPIPSAPEIHDLPDYNIEEQMIQAAIEASRKEAEIEASKKDVEISQQDDAEAGPSETQASKLTTDVDQEAAPQSSSNGRLGVETEVAAEEHPPGSTNTALNVNNNVNSSNNFPSDEWGGISSEEHDEAVMYEAALFGGIPEGTGVRLPNNYMENGFGAASLAYRRPPPRPTSPSLTAQRLIREQQDDEYLASLQADREKELLEQTAKEAAMEEEQRKLEQEQEIERQLAAKEASLPQEPTSDDENSVTLLVRMPDGSRRGRRFLRTNKLQHLFDYIDVGRVVKPTAYRLVRPYPRRAFSDGESELTLNELGLTSKQEALFLELI